MWLVVAATASACSSDGSNPGGNAGGPDAGVDANHERDAGVDASVGPDTGVDASKEDGAALNPKSFVWSFEDGVVGDDVSTAADAIADASGSDARATASPGLTYVRGQLGTTTAIQFDGLSDGIAGGAQTMSAVVDVEANEPFWIEVVFRTDVHGTDGIDGRGTLAAYGDPDDTGWQLFLADGRVFFSAASSAAIASVSADDLVADGRWHRVVAQRDGAGELSVALDGRTAARSGQAIPMAIAPSSAVRVGALKGSSKFVGAIDQVAFRRGQAVEVPELVAERQRAAVFLGGSEAVPGGGGKSYTSFRIPAIVRAPDGTLLAFAEGRVDNACDEGDIDIVSKRSTDGGKTWSALARIADNGPHKVGNPVPMVGG